MVKKAVAILLATCCLLLCACREQQPETGETLPVEETTAPVVQLPAVGISLPEENSYWQTQGALLTQQLEDIGYAAVVEYAAGQSKRQQSQLQELMEKQVEALIVAAVDAHALEQTLGQAKTAGIPVVAYERMLMHTDAVPFCVQPDSYAAGQQLAQYIINKHDPTPEAPKTIEFFMGSPDNDNSLQLYQGLMEQLRPLLDSGALMCSSGRVGFEDTCILGDSMQSALEQCYDYMLNIYKKGRPDILCCATDAMAEGCGYALEHFASQMGDEMPMVVSVGGTARAVARIAEGKQTATVFADTRQLAQTCARLTGQLLKGETLSETQTRNNGMTEIPCYTLSVAVIDSENYHLLLNTGVYTEEQLQQALHGEDQPDVSVPTETRAPVTTPPPTKGPTTPTETDPTETGPGGTTPGESTPTETTPGETTPGETTPPATTPPATEPPATTPPETQAQ